MPLIEFYQLQRIQNVGKLGYVPDTEDQTLDCHTAVDLDIWATHYAHDLEFKSLREKSSSHVPGTEFFLAATVIIPQDE